MFAVVGDCQVFLKHLDYIIPGLRLTVLVTEKCVSRGIPDCSILLAGMDGT